jgi:CheY-like chemotaxis protein
MKLILVVEDEHGNAEVVRLLLEATGYRVTTAANGKDALESLQGEKPAVILSDYMMPTMNGAELGLAVRRAAALAEIPFVFMSGTSEDVVRQAFRDYDAFMPKPFEVDALMAMIARFAESGRQPAPSSEEVGDSMRQLLKGIHLPPAE